MLVEATRPSADAVIDALPVPCPLTVPSELTGATEGLDDCHVIGLLLITWPFASRTVAFSFIDWPRVRLADVGSTATVATDCCTVTVI